MPRKGVSFVPPAFAVRASLHRSSHPAFLMPSARMVTGSDFPVL